MEIVFFYSVLYFELLRMMPDRLWSTAINLIGNVTFIIKLHVKSHRFKKYSEINYKGVIKKITIECSQNVSQHF